MRARRILFVCMQNSPHAARWINSLMGAGHDLHVFPIDHNPFLPSLRGVTVHPPYLRLGRKEYTDLLRRSPPAWWQGLLAARRAAHPNQLPVEPVLALALPHRVASLLDRIRLRTGESPASGQLFHGPRTLLRLIRRLQPDLIHSMEFQHCGYLVLAARDRAGGDFPPWLATNWGSDIYHFRQFPDHRQQIRRLLAAVDYYSCECERDITLARDLGLTAPALPVMPNSGGFDLVWTGRERGRLPTSRRRLIMVKGYEHFAGRALTALEALARCTGQLRDFDVVLFSPSAEPIARARQLRATGLIPSLTVLPYVTHEQMLRLHGLARVYLGVSVSDAISTSALEAMAMGAFPIQTDTSCCDEWFTDGEGGYLIPPDDVETIAARLRSALTDDALVDRAAAINWQTVQTRLDERRLRQQVQAFYDQVFAGGAAGGSA